MAFSAASSRVASRHPCAKQNIATSGANGVPEMSASGTRRSTEGSKVAEKSCAAASPPRAPFDADGTSRSRTPTSQ